MHSAAMTANRPTSLAEKAKPSTGRGQYWNIAKPIAVVTLLSGASVTLPSDYLAPKIQFNRSTSAGVPDKPYEADARGSVQPQQFTSVSHKLYALKRISGLTWEQIAALFDVDRRSVHLWANGKSLHPKNEEKLGRILSAILKIDRGFASSNRALLVTPTGNNDLPVDMLAAGEFDRVVELVGKGPQRVLQTTLVSAEERARRRPLSPLFQFETEAEDEPPLLGPVRAFKSIKAAKRDV